MDVTKPRRRCRKSPKVPGASTGSTIFNLIKGIVGSGLVVLPYDFKQTGYGFGTILMIVIMLASMFSLFQIAYSADHTHVYQYRSIAEYLYNPKFGILTAVTVIIYTIGSLMSYAIIIKTNTTFFIDKNWQRCIFLWAVGLAFVLPLSLLPKIDFLRFSSVMALIALLYIIIIILIFMVLVLKNPDEYNYLQRGEPPIISFNMGKSCMIAAPLIATAFTCHYNLGTQYSELRNRTPKKMLKAIIVTAATVMIINLLVAICGYVTFGESVSDNISKDLSRLKGSFGKIAGSIASCIMMLVVACTYPLVAFAVRKNIEALIFGAKIMKVKFLRSEAGLEMLKKITEDLNKKKAEEGGKRKKSTVKDEDNDSKGQDDEFKHQIKELHVVDENCGNTENIVTKESDTNADIYVERHDENEICLSVANDESMRSRGVSIAESMSENSRRQSIVEQENLIVNRYSFGTITQRANRELAAQVINEHKYSGSEKNDFIPIGGTKSPGQESIDGNVSPNSAAGCRGRAISYIDEIPENIAPSATNSNGLSTNQQQNEQTARSEEKMEDNNECKSEMPIRHKCSCRHKVITGKVEEAYPEEILKAVEVPVKRRWSILISCLIVAVTFTVASVVDSISDIVAFTSALCGSPIVYIYPSLFMIGTLRAKKAKKRMYVASIIVIVLGATFLCMGLYSAVQTKIIDRK